VGSAVVDFVLVSLILVPLFAAIMQLGFALYVRNTLAACAQDGARYAADANIVVQGNGAMADAATTRAASCVTDTLPGSFARGITASSPTITDSSGLPVMVVEVRIASPFPLVGLFGLGSHVLHAKGDALQELS
jgi:Flp pilus assembly protein TadG